MTSFQDIIGNKKILRTMQGALRTKKIAHAWLLDGERGTGKKTIAGLFARALLCGEGGENPCGRCRSCRMALSGNHPDLITVTHEKPHTLSVDEIREQVVEDILIRPYSGSRKIYLIPDAHLMSASAQNALLKTLEEPPGYAVLLLLSDNKELLLPTLISRSICLSMQPVEKKELIRYLTEKKGTPERAASLAASFSQGNLGRALLLSEDEGFMEMWNVVRTAVTHARTMDVPELAETAAKAAEYKEQRTELMEFFLFWFRDVLFYKSGGSGDRLIFPEEAGELATQAGLYSYEDLMNIIRAVEETAARLKSNVNFELSLELLLSEIREPGMMSRKVGDIESVPEQERTEETWKR